MAILEKLGCLSEQGMGKLRTGNAPEIMKGEFAGEIATVDHTIPRSVSPELDNKFYNLRFMAESLNQQKGNRVRAEELSLARRLRSLGLLSPEGLYVLEKHVEIRQRN